MIIALQFILLVYELTCNSLLSQMPLDHNSDILSENICG